MSHVLTAAPRRIGRTISRTPARALGLLLTLILVGTAVAAGPPPIDSMDGVQVNAVTTGNQGGPSIAMNASGSFVIVWGSAEVGGELIPKGQRFDSAGFAVGGELTLGTSGTGGQHSPSVMAQPGGQFVVAWEGDSAIWTRRFAEAGSPLTGELEVSLGTGNEYEPRLAGDATGGFAVVWRSRGSDPQGIFARRRTADASADTVAPFEVGAAVDVDPRNQNVASAASGDFVVVWEDLDGTADVWGEMRDASGTAVGSPFLVPASNGGDESQPDVARRPTGGFVVVWATTDILARVFDADGTPLTGDLPVNDFTGGSEETPAVALAGNGDFVVTWENQSDDSVWGRLFDSMGSPFGLQFSIAQDLQEHYANPAVAFDPQGRVVATWETSLGKETEVFARRLDQGCRGDTKLGDMDTDGVCNDRDVCEGGNDNLDADLDFVPDACDLCPGFDDADDDDGDMIPDGCDPDTLFLDGFESGDTTAW